MSCPDRPHETVIDTWLPIFPGFYGTFFEPPDSVDDDEYEKWMDTYGFENSDGLVHLWDPTELFEHGYHEYRNEMAQRCTAEIEQWLMDAIPGAITSVQMQYVQRPREYNFGNDVVCIRVTAYPDGLTNMVRAYLEKHEKNWVKYLKAKFKSRSGFMSFHPHTPKEWFECTEGYSDWSDGDKAGSVLEFVLLDEGYTDEDLLDSVEKPTLSVIPKEGMPEYEELPWELREFYDQRAIDVKDLSRQFRDLNEAGYDCDVGVLRRTEAETAREVLDALKTWRDDEELTPAVREFANLKEVLR